MKVNVKGQGEVEFEDGMSISDLVEKLDYHKDSVIVLKDDEPTPLDEDLEDGMSLKIISVVSGG